MKIWWDEKNEEFIIKNKEEEDTTSSRSKYKKKLKVRVENIKNCVQQGKINFYCTHHDTLDKHQN
jgi:hypothetical protein